MAKGLHKMRKTKTILIIAAAVLLLLGGCGRKMDLSFDKVRYSGELVVGLDENFPPMGFRDESGELIGFDIDLAREVCKRLGIRLTLCPIEWDRKEEELDSGRIDCIWNGLSVTEERAETMLLSEPYLKNELVFALRSYSDIQNTGDLRGKTVGVQSGSTAADAIKEADIFDDISVVYQKDNLTLLDQLKNNELDAVLIDSISIYYIASNSEDFVLLSGALSSEDIAIGFRKDDEELKRKIQEKLSEMKSDGTLSEISEKWFGYDITIIR